MGGSGGGGGGFLVITVSHPTFCCVGVGLWLRWGWAVTTLNLDYTQARIAAVQT